MKKKIAILLMINLFGCSNQNKTELNDSDKIEIINKIINSKEFYNNLSKIYRDSIPTIVINKLITKDILSKVVYHNSNVHLSIIDSTESIKWKSDWLHPKFYIDFEKIEFKDNKVNIILRVRSTGIYGRITFEFKEKKWVILNQKYVETK